MRWLLCTFSTRVDSDRRWDSSFLSNSSSSQLLSATRHVRTHYSTTHTHAESVLFSLHQALVQDKTCSNFLIIPIHRNSHFIHSYCRADLPEKSSGNEKNTPTSIFIYLFLIHFELMVVSVNDELKWKPVLFVEVANVLLIPWRNDGEDLVWGEEKRWSCTWMISTQAELTGLVVSDIHSVRKLWHERPFLSKYLNNILASSNYSLVLASCGSKNLKKT